MFAGHIGVALAISHVEPRINVGLLVAASLLLDLLLWLFVLVGCETVVIPADFQQTHQPRFGFPYSHGLLFSVVWSATAGASVFLLSVGSSREKFRAALLLAAVVVSHWLLDVLVHRPELPVATTGSLQLGFGLWSNMTVALAVEAALVIGGLSLLFAGRSIVAREKAGPRRNQSACARVHGGRNDRGAASSFRVCHGGQLIGRDPSGVRALWLARARGRSSRVAQGTSPFELPQPISARQRCAGVERSIA